MVVAVQVLIVRRNLLAVHVVVFRAWPWRHGMHLLSPVLVANRRGVVGCRRDVVPWVPLVDRLVHRELATPVESTAVPTVVVGLGHVVLHVRSRVRVSSRVLMRNRLVVAWRGSSG